MLIQSFFLRKSSAFKVKFGIFMSLLLICTSCIHQQNNGPKILTGFSERLTALVTTTTRSNLRDDPLNQKFLTEKLPSLEKKTSLNQLMEELKMADPLKALAYLIEADVMFELEKPENKKQREHLNSYEVQNEIVSSIIAGIRRALSQLKEVKNGK